MFILGYVPPNLMRVENEGVTYKLLRDLGVFPFIPPTRTNPISVSPPLWREFYLVLVSARLGMTFDSIWGCLSSLGAITLDFRLLCSENISPEGSGENVSFPHITSRSSLEAGNPSRSVVLLGAQAHWRVQESHMRVCMCYMCFCSTLASMLPKNLNYY